jgi:hypothetical protein
MFFQNKPSRGLTWDGFDDIVDDFINNGVISYIDCIKFALFYEAGNWSNVINIKKINETKFYVMVHNATEDS